MIVTGINHVGVQPTVRWAPAASAHPNGRPVVAGAVGHVLEGHQRRGCERRDAVGGGGGAQLSPTTHHAMKYGTDYVTGVTVQWQAASR